MSPTKGSTKSIKIHVPRHNSQRLGPLTISQVEAIARKKKQRVDIRQTAYESSSIMAQAVDHASEWNSLLMTARAERGPQWDIGTQQFLVDEYSELYYDPTPIREHEMEAKSEEAESQQKTERQSMPPPDVMASPQIRRGPHSNSQGPSPMVYANSPRHASQIPPGMPFNNMPPVPPAQFYGNGDMGGPSPMRMGNMGVPIDPMGSMGAGMAVGMGNMGMGMGPMGNMGPMGVPMGMSMGGGMGMGSPDPRRGAMRRGMSMGMGDDGYGGMH